MEKEVLETGRFCGGRVGGNPFVKHGVEKLRGRDNPLPAIFAD